MNLAPTTNAFGPTGSGNTATTGHTGFSGLWIPLVPPFSSANGDAVDHVALAKLVTHYHGCGVSGFVACGTTGEAAALSKSEQWAVLDTVLAHAQGLPVVMGVSGYHLEDAVAFGQQACQRPIAGLLVASPHYIRPSQAGLKLWFERLADAWSQPVVVYDIPFRTGVELHLETLLSLAAHPNIRAVKDCGGNAGKTQALIADGRLQVLAGEDMQIFGTVAAGGSGAIAASAHLRTAEFARVISLLQAGKTLEARALWRPLVGLMAALFAEPNPTVIKSALAQTGWTENRLRPPMQTATQAFDLRLLDEPA